jgi:hypothetical protein
MFCSGQRRLRDVDAAGAERRAPVTCSWKTGAGALVCLTDVNRPPSGRLADYSLGQLIADVAESPIEGLGAENPIHEGGLPGRS